MVDEVALEQGFPPVLLLPHINVIPPMLHILLLLYVALTRKINRQRQETSKSKELSEHVEY